MSITKAATDTSALKPNSTGSGNNQDLLAITRQVVEGSAIWNRVVLDVVFGGESASELAMNYSITPKMKAESKAPNSLNMTTNNWNDLALRGLSREA